MPTYTLYAGDDGDDGNPLYFHDTLLLYRYSAGDVDMIPWPLVSSTRSTDKLKEQLACCIFDLVEEGVIPSDHGSFTILLPDGTEFPYLDYVP